VRWLRAGAFAAGLGVAVTAAPGIAAADDTAATSGSNPADAGSSIAVNPKATSASSPDPKTNRRATHARKPASNVEGSAGTAVAGNRRSVVLPQSGMAPLAQNSAALIATAPTASQASAVSSAAENPRAATTNLPSMAFVAQTAQPAATVSGASVTSEAVAPILRRSATPYPTPAATAVSLKEILKSVNWLRLGAFAPGMPPPINPLADLASAIWVGSRRVHYTYENANATLNPTPPTVDAETTVFTGSLGSVGRDGDLLTYTVSSPSHGTIEVDQDGTYTYTPNAELAHNGGTDTFTASVTGLRLVKNVFGFAGVLRYVIPNMPVSETAAPTTTVVTVNIPIGLVNADPILEAPAFGATDSRTGSVSGTINFADADGDEAEFTTYTAPARGSVVVDAATGAFTYTPNAAGRHAAAADGATAADLSDTFTIAVDDGHGGTTLKTITVAISPVNTAPTVGTASSGANPTTGATAGTLTATDADNDIVTFTAVTSPSKGTLIFNPSGAFTYTPNAGVRHAAAAAGATAADLTDTFTIAANDGHGGTSLKTITVAISPANTAPSVTAASSVVSPTTGAIAGTLTATDADNDTVTFTAITSPSKGALTVLPSGAFFYVPTVNARIAAAVPGAAASALTDTFTVLVSDGHGGQLTLPVVVAVNPRPNSAPNSLSLAFNASTASLLTSLRAYQPAVPANPSGGRDTLTGGELFLGGNYIELGLSSVGSFGTSGSAPAGFFGTSGNPRIGLSNDVDGFGNGVDSRIDFFIPGAPEERWSVGYNGTQYGGFSGLRGNAGTSTTLTGTSLTDTSSGSLLSGTFVATVGGDLQTTQVHSFRVNDSFFQTEVTLNNVGANTLTDVQFMRSFDPDNTVFQSGSYTTINTVRGQVSTDGVAAISGTSQPGDAYNTLTGQQASVLFMTSESDGQVYLGGFTNSNPYDFDSPVQATGYTQTTDGAIGILFKAGDLAPGASVTYKYYTVLSTDSSVTSIINRVDNPTVVEATPGAQVGTITANDPDAGDALNFTVSDSRFEVATVGASTVLKLRNGVSLDYNTDQTVALTITATDPAGATFSRSFTVDVLQGVVVTI
jgi:VCBS repeat-containing protein